MILEKGDMWSILDQTELFCITTNSTVVNGKLVMGAGIALEAKQRFPELPELFGNLIIPNEVYGFMVVDLPPSIGAFQTKKGWRQNSYLNIIKYSCSELNSYIILHNFTRVDLNFPGIGKGNLKRNQVLPIISLLPDVVHIWEKDDD